MVCDSYCDSAKTGRQNTPHHNISNIHHLTTSFFNMSVGGRPQYDIDDYREDVRRLYETGGTYDSITQFVSGQLGQPVSKRTIERRVKTWGLQRRHRRCRTNEKRDGALEQVRTKPSGYPTLRIAER